MANRKKESINATAPVESGLWRQRLRQPVFLSLLLVLATSITFSPILRNEFVNYDDSDYVTSNAHVQSGLNWENVVWAFSSGHASNWHPITWLSHMLDCQVFGLSPVAHHLVNLGFHLANVLLLFMVVRFLTGAYWRSALVAALFALHPLHVESVAWISERKDVLSTFFFLLTLWAYSQYARACLNKRVETCHGKDGVPPLGGAVHRPPKGGTPYLVSKQAPRAGRGGAASRGPEAIAPRLEHPSQGMVTRRALWYGLSLLLFAFGLMSKPMLVTTPFLLLLLDFWPLGRFWPVSGMHPGASATHAGFDPGRSIEPNPTSGLRTQRRSWLWLLGEKVPFLALAAASSLITFVVQRKGGAVSTALPLGERVANAVVSYVRYLGKTLWPENLSVLYPHPGHWPVWQVIGSGVLLAMISTGVVMQGRKRPYLFTGWFWFFGALIPVIGLVQVGIQSMADRYAYIPSIGLLIVLVWGGGELAAALSWPESFLKSIATACLVACCLLTARQVTFWRNSQTLFTRAVQVTSNNYLAYNNLGFYQSGKGQIVEAMENYRRSLEINPAYEDALNNMGYALTGLKRPAEAVPYYESALRVRPNHVEVHNNLGNALSELGKLEEAIRHYLLALKEKPDHADAHNNLGIALAMQGKLDEAIPHFLEAIRFKPQYASAHSNLGNALAAQHRLAEAIGEYRESLRLNPEDAQAHNNLANVLTEQGKLDEAVPHYDQALKLNVNNPEAHFNLGMVLARQGRRDQAIAHFTEALRLQPSYTQARQQLELIGAQK